MFTKPKDQNIQNFGNNDKHKSKSKLRKFKKNLKKRNNNQSFEVNKEKKMKFENDNDNDLYNEDADIYNEDNDNDDELYGVKSTAEDEEDIEDLYRDNNESESVEATIDNSMKIDIDLNNKDDGENKLNVELNNDDQTAAADSPMVVDEEETNDVNKNKNDDSQYTESNEILYWCVIYSKNGSIEVSK